MTACYQPCIHEQLFISSCRVWGLRRSEVREFPVATTLTEPATVTSPVAVAVGLRRTSAWSLAEVRWAAAATVLFGFGLAAHFGDGPVWLSWALLLACYVTGGWEPGL